ncbi:hypothetical protein D3C85_1621970 [compost metagenome]
MRAVEVAHLREITLEPLADPLAVLSLRFAFEPWLLKAIEHCLRGLHASHQCLEYAVRSCGVENTGRIAHPEKAGTGRRRADTPAHIGPTNRPHGGQHLQAFRHGSEQV